MKAFYVLLLKTSDSLISNYTVSSKRRDTSADEMIFYVDSLSDFNMNLLLTSSVSITVERLISPKMKILAVIILCILFIKRILYIIRRFSVHKLLTV